MALEAYKSTGPRRTLKTRNQAVAALAPDLVPGEQTERFAY